MCSEEQSNHNTKMVLEQLVALTINQDHVAQGWLRFIAALRAGIRIAISSAIIAITTNNSIKVRLPLFQGLSGVCKRV